MKTIKLFIEGGGDYKIQKTRLRDGFDTFFEELKDIARERLISFQIVLCGSRNEAWEAFENERIYSPAVRSVLLVDSEEVMDATPKEHLMAREHSWALQNVPDDHVNVMATTMETWIVADASALEKFYNGGFLLNRMPTNSDLERVSKADIATNLRAATANTQKREYQKIKHGAELLKKIDPTIVRGKCRNCELLFTRLQAVIARF